MTDADSPAKPAKKKRTTRAARIALLALGLYFIPACGLAVLSGGSLFFLVVIPFTVAFGIVSYPLRVLPLVSVDPMSVASFVALLVVLGLVAHTFLVAVFRGRPGTRSWTPRATATLLLAVLTVFVAAMAVAGIGHQVGWLVSGERLLENSWDNAPCNERRAETPMTWLERWRVMPLDGKPALTSGHYIAVPRDVGEHARGNRRPHECGRESMRGGRSIDAAEVTRLLGPAQSPSSSSP